MKPEVTDRILVPTTVNEIKANIEHKEIYHARRK